MKKLLSALNLLNDNGQIKTINFLLYASFANLFLVGDIWSTILFVSSVVLYGLAILKPEADKSNTGKEVEELKIKFQALSSELRKLNLKLGFKER